MPQSRGPAHSPHRRIAPIPPSLDLTERMRNRYEDLFIDANTCVTHYDGSPMDWNLAVGALFQ
ncbi:MAG: hypothetical protein GXP15_05020 [Gammaproteobacteria bacterium]|nr:hypothetical protein [Gammaproteobacteria bacterium]